MIFSFRKWGWYITLISRDRFKVKFLWFRKGEECSIQHHKKRNELWLFLFGKGIISDSFVLENRGNGLTFMGNDCHAIEGSMWRLIKRGDWHLYKALKTTLVLEIQFGDECIESDIVRL